MEESFASQDGDLLFEPLDNYEGESHVNASINSPVGWTGNDQDTRTVKPKDLVLRAPV